MSLDERDLELLSAYLDNALTVEERAQVETRLAADPALKRELERLRLTRGLVRDLPQLKAPRPFTLTPAMIEPPHVLLFPATVAFSVVSAAAAIIVLLAGVILLSTGRQPNAAQVANLPTNTALAAASNLAATFTATFDPTPMAETPEVEIQMFSAVEPTESGADDAQADEAEAPAEAAEAGLADAFIQPTSEKSPTPEEVGDAAGAAMPVAPMPFATPSLPTPPPQATLVFPTMTPMPSPQADLLQAEESVQELPGARLIGSPTPELAEEAAPAAALLITMTASPPPTGTKAPTITLSHTPAPTITHTPTPTPAPAVAQGDGSSIGTALIVLAALLFLLSAAAFMRRNG